MEAVTPRAARSTGAGPYVFHGGTYNGTPIALAAGNAVLDLLEDGDDVDAPAGASADTLRAGLARVCADKGIDVQVLGRGAVADFYFTADPITSSRGVWASDLARRRAVDYALLAAGVFNAPLHRWHLSRRTARTTWRGAWSGWQRCWSRRDRRNGRCRRATTRARGLRARAGAVCSPAAGSCVGRTEEIGGAGQFVVRVDRRRERHRDPEAPTPTSGGVLQRVPAPRAPASAARRTGRFADRIQCPYHAWTYGLDGRLLAAPHMDAAPRASRMEDHGLARRRRRRLGRAPVREPVGHGRAARGTRRRAGGRSSPPGTWSGLRRVYRVTYDVKANWKLIVQNYSECLHCPVIHPALQRLSHHASGVNDPSADTWTGGSMELADGVFTMSRDGAERRPPLPGLDDRQRRHVYYYVLVPNLLLSLHPDYVMTHTLWPKACDRTEVVCEWHFHPAEHARPTFDPGDVIDFWDETNRQDWQVSELSQLGIGSRAYQPGPYSTREGLLWDFDQIVRRGLGD